MQSVLKCFVRSSPLNRFARWKSSTSDNLSQFKNAYNLKVNELLSKPVKSDKDWSNIRAAFQNAAGNGDNDVDLQIVKSCAKTVDPVLNALSYRKFLAAQSLPVDIKLESTILKMYSKCLAQRLVDAQCESQIIPLCIRLSESISELNDATINQLLKVLGRTGEWKHCVEIINKYNLKCSKENLKVFSDISANAFWENEVEIGWKMMRKIVEEHFAPNCISFIAYWHHCAENRDQFVVNVEKMLNFIGRNDILISKIAINELKKELDQLQFHASNTKINFHGHCMHCQQDLDRTKLSKAEFIELKKKFEQTIMSKEMIARNSSRGELIRFQQQVNKKHVYHYVIDGLNVCRGAAGSKGNLVQQSRLLADLVKEYVDQRKRVLVIGRKHMEKWPEEQLNYIKKNAKFFLTSNESDDDPYLIYGALLSGPSSHIISRDAMQDYAKQLDEETRWIFKRWQKEHQHIIEYDNTFKTFKVVRPSQFSNYAHKIGKGQWHVPYVDKPIDKSNALLRPRLQWICFNLTKPESDTSNLEPIA